MAILSAVTEAAHAGCESSETERRRKKTDGTITKLEEADGKTGEGGGAL